MKNFWPTIRYAILTVKHKWFVLLAGLRLGVPLWRLLTHDLSKFSPAELPHYGRQFFGAKDDHIGFAVAWAHHQNHNDHHWEWWITRTGHFQDGGDWWSGSTLPMTRVAVMEMVADWMGASRAYEGVWPTPVSWPWLWKNRKKIADRMSSCTATLVAEVLTRAGFGPLLQQEGEDDGISTDQ